MSVQTLSSYKSTLVQATNITTNTIIPDTNIQ